MKKAMIYTWKLSLWIFSLFTIMMLISYFNNYLQTSGFFGDTYLGPNHKCEGGDCDWDWGARHYWYLWMGVFLFIIQIIRIFIWSGNYWKHELNRR
jgi:hypothetical protein